MKFNGSINNSKVAAEVAVFPRETVYDKGCVARVEFVFEGYGDGVVMQLMPSQPSTERAWEHAKRCMAILGFEEADDAHRV